MLDFFHTHFAFSLSVLQICRPYSPWENFQVFYKYPKISRAFLGSPHVGARVTYARSFDKPTVNARPPGRVSHRPGGDVFSNSQKSMGKINKMQRGGLAAHTKIVKSQDCRIKKERYTLKGIQKNDIKDLVICSKCKNDDAASAGLGIFAGRTDAFGSTKQAP